MANARASGKTYQLVKLSLMTGIPIFDFMTSRTKLYKECKDSVIKNYPELSDKKLTIITNIDRLIYKPLHNDNILCVLVDEHVSEEKIKEFPKTIVVIGVIRNVGNDYIQIRGLNDNSKIEIM